MHNKPGQGPTRPDKTIERMAQERSSPGATSEGGHNADAPDNDTRQGAGTPGNESPLSSSINNAARRGAAPDAAADKP